MRFNFSILILALILASSSCRRQVTRKIRPRGFGSISLRCKNGRCNTAPVMACRAGSPMINEERFEKPGDSIMVFPSLRVTCAGEITAWKFVPKFWNIAGIHLAIFRGEPGSGRFRLVGLNSLSPKTRFTRDRWSLIRVPSQNRIQVKTGDVLGILFDQYANGLWNSPVRLAYPNYQELYAGNYEAFTSEISLKDFFSMGNKTVNFLEIGQHQTNYGIPPVRALIGRTIKKKSLKFSKKSKNEHQKACLAGSPMLSENRFKKPGEKTMIFPGLQINCEGEISEWNLVPATWDLSGINLVVFRQVNAEEYQIVGFNTPPKMKSMLPRGQWGRWTVEPDRRVQVKVGDVLGIVFNTYSSKNGIKLAQATARRLRFNNYDAFTSGSSFEELMADKNMTVMFSKRKLRKMFGIPPLRAFVKQIVKTSLLKAKHKKAPLKNHYCDCDSVECRYMFGKDVTLPYKDCLAGSPLIDESRFTTPASSIAIFPGLKAACDGVITEWKIVPSYANLSGLSLGVFRPTRSLGTYEIVGVNMLESMGMAIPGKWTSFKIKKGWPKITVQRNDVLGFVHRRQSVSMINIGQPVPREVGGVSVDAYVSRYGFEDLGGDRWNSKKIDIARIGRFIRRYGIAPLRAVVRSTQTPDGKCYCEKSDCYVTTTEPPMPVAPWRPPITKPPMPVAPWRPPITKPFPKPFRPLPPRPSPPSRRRPESYVESAAHRKGDCRVGSPKIDEYRFVQNGKSVMVFPGLKLSCSGFITEWSIVASSWDLTHVNLAVFRPYNTGATSTMPKFQMVDFFKPKVDISKAIGEWLTLVVEKPKNKVQFGDLLGIFYDSPSPIGYSTFRLAKPNPRELLYYDFDAYTSDCGIDLLSGRIMNCDAGIVRRSAFGIPPIRVKVNKTAETSCQINPGSPECQVYPGIESSTCRAGSPMIFEDRFELAAPGRALIFPGLRIGCTGEIGKWEFVSKQRWATSGINLAVFRHHGTTNRYVLVGSNNLTMPNLEAKVEKWSVATVDEPNRIPVEMGDILGIILNRAAIGSFRLAVPSIREMQDFDFSVLTNRETDFHRGSSYSFYKSEFAIPPVRAHIFKSNDVHKTRIPKASRPTSAFPSTTTTTSTTTSTTTTTTTTTKPTTTTTEEPRVLCNFGAFNVSQHRFEIPGAPLVVFPNLRIGCSGNIYAWDILPAKSNLSTLTLFVMRPFQFNRKANDQRTGYEIVGHLQPPRYRNFVRYEWNRWVTPESERVSVKQGDVIGYYDNDPDRASLLMATLTPGEGFSGIYDAFVANNSLIKVFRQFMDTRGILDLEAFAKKTYSYAIPPIRLLITSCNTNNASLTSSTTTASKAMFRTVAKQENSVTIYQNYTGGPDEMFARLNITKTTPEPGCKAGPPLLSGSRFVSTGASLMIFDGFKVGCSGEVSQWSFVPTDENATGLYLAFFRRKQPGNGEQFEIVGMNSPEGQRTFQPNVWNNWVVPPAERFIVRPGDVVGVFYTSQDQIPVLLAKPNIRESVEYKLDTYVANFTLQQLAQNYVEMLDFKLIGSIYLNFGIPPIRAYVAPQSVSKPKHIDHVIPMLRCARLPKLVTTKEPYCKPRSVERFYFSRSLNVCYGYQYQFCGDDPENSVGAPNNTGNSFDSLSQCWQTCSQFSVKSSQSVYKATAKSKRTSRLLQAIL